MRDSRRDSVVYNSLMDSVGEGEGGKIWENGIETCKISCMKRDASPGSMHDTGCSGLVHWDDLEVFHYHHASKVMLKILQAKLR